MTIRTRVQVQYQELTEPIQPPVVPAFDPGTDGFPYIQHPDGAVIPRAAAAILVAAIPFFFCPEVPAEQIPPPELSWAPEYPDFARGPQPNTHEQYVRPEIDPPTIPPPILSWAPVYPDFARDVEPLNVTDLTQFAYGQAEDRWGLDPFLQGEIPWLPVYPDEARAAEPINVGSSFTESLEPLVAAPFDPGTDGFPYQQQPDQTYAPERSVEYAAFFQPEETFPVPIPELSWSPEYPNMVPGAARPVDVGWFAQNVEPIPAAAPVPELSWAPTYPDEVRVAPSIVEHDAYFAPDQVPAVMLNVVRGNLFVTLNSTGDRFVVLSSTGNAFVVLIDED